LKKIFIFLVVAIIVITFSSCGLNSNTQVSEGQVKKSDTPIITQSHDVTTTKVNPSSSPLSSQDDDETKDALNVIDDLEKTLNSLDDVGENDLTIPSP